MKKAVFLLLLLSAAVPALAQHGQSTGFMFISPAEISIARDNNFLVDRTPPNQKLLLLSLPASVLPAAPSIRPETLDDNVIFLKAPTVALLRDTRKQDFSFTYQPEFELFTKNSDQNSINHRAMADVNLFFTRKVQLYIGDGYVSSKDATRTLENIFLLIPRNRYTENAFRTSLSFLPTSRTAYTVAFDSTASTYGENDPLQRRMLDTIGKSGSFTVAHKLRRTQRIRLTYAVFKLGPWNRKKNADERVDTQFVSFSHPAQSLSGGYQFRLNHKTNAEFSGGVVGRDTDVSYTFGFYVDRQMGEVTLGGGYSRSLSFLTPTQQITLPNGLSANSFYDLVTVHLRGQPKKRVAIDLSASAIRSVYDNVAIGSKAFMGRSRLDYRLNDSVVAFFGAETYHQNLNEYIAAPLSRYRFFTGLQYSFSNESQRRTSRLNRDADNVSLTEHGRLRNRPQ